jgi:hypothetical protein
MEGIMPGGKARLASLLTSGLKVGSASTDTYMKSILAGSVTFTGPAFDAGIGGSTATCQADITGITASHTLVVTAQDISPCMTIIGACAGAGNASFVFAYTSASGGEAACTKTTIIKYIAVKT